MSNKLKDRFFKFMSILYLIIIVPEFKRYVLPTIVISNIHYNMMHEFNLTSVSTFGFIFAIKLLEKKNYKIGEKMLSNLPISLIIARTGCLYKGCCGGYLMNIIDICFLIIVSLLFFQKYILLYSIFRLCGMVYCF